MGLLGLIVSARHDGEIVDGQVVEKYSADGTDWYMVAVMQDGKVKVLHCLASTVFYVNMV